MARPTPSNDFPTPHAARTSMGNLDLVFKVRSGPSFAFLGATRTATGCMWTVFPGETGRLLSRLVATATETQKDQSQLVATGLLLQLIATG